MRGAVGLWIAISGCYAPSLRGGTPCDPVLDNCLIGETCVLTARGGVCMAGGGAGSNGGPEAGSGSGVCLGGNLLGQVCLTSTPTRALTFTGTTTINAGSTGSGGCTEILPQRDGPALCVVAAASIFLPSSATLRGVSVVPSGMTINGTNALVLVALDSIRVEGTIDVSTHNETIGGDPVVGPGARTAAGCLALGIDGKAGTGSFGGAGGAGGSFGGAGGAGGSGGNNGNIAAGTPARAATPSVLMGGCPGGHGGDGAGASLGGGAGGGAGGAVYLLAGSSITISGTINASGAGGRGGSSGDVSAGGGGGGGAGGMIGVEADSLRITDQAALFANGGGGGAGGVPSDVAARSGADPIAPTVAASGGIGVTGGGSGGSGAAGATLAGLPGARGSGSAAESAGGGGGGGAGVIQIFAGSRVINGTLSPPAR